MISIDEARRMVLEHTGVLQPESIALVESPGRILAAPIISDIDSPPYDKSLMDGYALRAVDLRATDGRATDGRATDVRAADVRAAQGVLKVVDEITAGQIPMSVVAPGTAVRIMTGAPLPQGADAVVMHEQTVSQPNEPFGKTGAVVRITAERVEPEQHILRQGATLSRGAVVAAAGHLVRAHDIGLFTEVGCSHVQVIRPARVSVLTTGNELVPAEQLPGPGKIRNSNGPMLSALAAEHGARVSNLGICGDDLNQLVAAIDRGLNSDLLLLSGGVSTGVLDLVPKALARCGVKQIFHRVKIKPGKPIWFGCFRPDFDQRSAESVVSNGRVTLVFALPGNPLASLVGYQLFVLPALRKLQGHPGATPDPMTGQLACDYCSRGDRPTYVPSYAEQLSGGQTVVTPLRWRGSADQSPIAAANCLACFPAGQQEFTMGQTVELIPFVTSLPRV